MSLYTRQKTGTLFLVTSQTIPVIPLLSPDKKDFETALRRQNKRKGPGSYLIGTTMLQIIPDTAINFLREQFNSRLRLHYFFCLWKTIDIATTAAYASWKLLLVVSKVFEKILLARMSPVIDDLILHEQFGFRREHSTTLQLVRVLSDATNPHLIVFR